MTKRKHIYPGTKDAEKERSAYKRKSVKDEKPDFIGNAPNYDKFTGWTAEKVFVWLNID